MNKVNERIDEDRLNEEFSAEVVRFLKEIIPSSLVIVASTCEETVFKHHHNILRKPTSLKEKVLGTEILIRIATYAYPSPFWKVPITLQVKDTNLRLARDLAQKLTERFKTDVNIVRR